jgi:hypothetical protein
VRLEVRPKLYIVSERQALEFTESFIASHRKKTFVFAPNSGVGPLMNNHGQNGNIGIGGFLLLAGIR